MMSKTPAYSATIKTEVVCPNDTNPMGILQGGRLVQWMDIAAAVCAQTHAGGICVTASIDKVSFYHAAKVGDILTIQAKITRAFNTSMEIMTESFVRNVFDNEQRLLSTAYFTFVAIDDHANARQVAPVKAETEKELKQYEAAAVRRAGAKATAYK